MAAAETPRAYSFTDEDIDKVVSFLSALDHEQFNNFKTNDEYCWEVYEDALRNEHQNKKSYEDDSERMTMKEPSDKAAFRQALVAACTKYGFVDGIFDYVNAQAFAATGAAAAYAGGLPSAAGAIVGRGVYLWTRDQSRTRTAASVSRACMLGLFLIDTVTTMLPGYDTFLNGMGLGTFTHILSDQHVFLLLHHKFLKFQEAVFTKFTKDYRYDPDLVRLALNGTNEGLYNQMQPELNNTIKLVAQNFFSQSTVPETNNVELGLAMAAAIVMFVQGRQAINSDFKQLAIAMCMVLPYLETILITSTKVSVKEAHILGFIVNVVILFLLFYNTALKDAASFFWTKLKKKTGTTFGATKSGIGYVGTIVGGIVGGIVSLVVWILNNTSKSTAVWSTIKDSIPWDKLEELYKWGQKSWASLEANFDEAARKAETISADVVFVVVTIVLVASMIAFIGTGLCPKGKIREVCLNFALMATFLSAAIGRVESISLLPPVPTGALVSHQRKTRQRRWKGARRRPNAAMVGCATKAASNVAELSRSIFFTAL